MPVVEMQVPVLTLARIGLPQHDGDPAVFQREVHDEFMQTAFRQCTEEVARDLAIFEHIQ